MSSYGYDVNSCPDGLILKEFWEGAGPSFRKYKKCVAPNTESDCPANTKFTKEPVPSGITVIGGDGFQNRCRPVSCPNGQVLKEIGGGIDKYGNEIKSEYRCVAPTSVLDCPPNTRFYSPTRGIYTPAKCIPISNDGYDEGYGQTSNKCAGDFFSVECNDGSCDITNGVVAACTGKGGVKGITSVNPVEKVVDVIKPKTEEEEYRNFIFLTMAAVGVYLILSE